jgi:hypothetical protein
VIHFFWDRILGTYRRPDARFRGQRVCFGVGFGRRSAPGSPFPHQQNQDFRSARATIKGSKFDQHSH